MAKVSKLLAGAAVLIGISVPATAAVAAKRSHVARHRAHSHVLLVRRRVIQVVGPGTYLPLQPGEFVDPANPGYIHGVDDGSRYDTESDGIAAGQDGDLIQRDPRLGGPYRGPGLELEGPPIGPSLPVIPALVDPDLQ